MSAVAIKTPSALILGAGPAGMATAMELHKKDFKGEVTVIEKNARVGGLARTLTFQEGNDLFRTDIGPHRFYSKNPYLYTFIEDLLGEEWIRVNRFTRFYIGGKFYLYPIQWKNVLRNMGMGMALRTMIDFFKERALDIGRTKPAAHFEEYAVRTFGRTLAELNMLNYTEKIWGLPCRELSVDWSQRIKGLSFWGAVKNAFFGRSHDSPKTMVDEFFYPALGAGQTYERIYEKLKGQYPFLLESTPTRIHHHDGRVTQVVVRTPRGEEMFAPDVVVSSIPITELIALLEPAPPVEIVEHMRQLRYRSQVYLFITLNKPQIFPDQWIYLPELSIPFGRVSEMKNFSPAMAPPGATSLFIEFFCWEGDEIWRADAEELLTRSLPFFESWGWFTRKDIRKLYAHRQTNVYPVYDLTYATHLNAIKSYVDVFANLKTIGRPGRFKYNNQDHSLEMGIMAARSIVEGTRYDFDHVMGDAGYLESGRVPPSTRSQES